MAKTKSIDAPFRKGERVIATAGLPGVPEGTTGKVKLVNGLTWTRYWVFFDNGIDMGSIDNTKLVRVKDYDAFKERREHALANPGAVAAADGGAAASAPAAEPAAAGSGSRVPEHLIERTKRRREQLGLS
jgi:hypothetical protein